ncbi:MAG: APC family permease [Acidobacteriota bacterium]
MEAVENIIETPSEQRGKLLKILGVTFGIAVTIGGMIGLGILRTPGSVAAQLGSFWLILAIWVLGGLYAILGTISVAELSTSLPTAGGWYVYARRAFGDYGGFVVGWSDWLSACATIAFVAITIGEYLPKLFPALSDSIKVIAFIALFVFGLLNWLGLRVGSQIQEVTSFAKAFAFLILIAACFIYGGQPPANAEQATLTAPVGMTATFLTVMLALQAVIYTYDGWYGAIYFAEEDRDPARNLPRAMLFGVASVMAIYLLVNLAFLYILPLAQFTASDLPAGDAAEVVFGASGSQIISLLALVSLSSIININLMYCPRILFSMSRDNLFWSKAATVNKGGTPVWALLLTVVVGIILAASGTFEILLSITAFLFVLNYTSGFLAVFILRRKEPDLPRPFKAWGYPWTTLIVLIGSIIFLVGQIISDTRNSLYAVGLIIASYPVFLITKKLKKSESRIAAE